MNTKKIITGIMAMVIMGGAMAIMPCQATSEYTLGDVTLDGVVDNTDCKVLRDYLIGLRPLSNVQKSVADLHYDREVDVKDLLALKQAVWNCAGTSTITVEDDELAGVEVLNDSSLLSYNRNQGGLEAFVDNESLDMGAFLDDNSISIDCRKRIGSDFYSMGASLDDGSILVQSTRTLGDQSTSLIEMRKGNLFSGVKLVNVETNTTIQATQGGFIINDQQIMNYHKDSELASMMVKGLGESFKVDDVEVKQTEKGRIVFNDGEQCSIESLANVRICYFGGQFLRMEKKDDVVLINSVESLRDSTLCEVEQFTVLREDNLDNSITFRFYDNDTEDIYELTVNEKFGLVSFRKLSNPSVGSVKVVKVQPIDKELECSVEYYDYSYKLSKFCSEETPVASYTYSGCYDFNGQELTSKSVSKPVEGDYFCSYYSETPDSESYGLINRETGLKEFLVCYSPDTIEAVINEGQLMATLREDDKTIVVENTVDNYGSIIKYFKDSNESTVTAQFNKEDLYSANLNYDVMMNHDYSKIYKD